MCVGILAAGVGPEVEGGQPVGRRCRTRPVSRGGRGELAALAERERRDTDVGVSDVLASAGCDAAHAINHPGNTIFAELARRVLAELGVGGSVELGSTPLLGSVRVPLEQRMLDALHLTGQARSKWSFHGASIEPSRVHHVQMHWYRDHPDYLRLAVERHGSTMELLGLSTAFRFDDFVEPPDGVGPQWVAN